MRRDVFQAIADPTRRDILKILSQRELQLNAIAENFAISRPAISRHIKILTECGLVVIKKQGRERFCSAHFTKLREVSHWVAQYEGFWMKKLDALEFHLSTKQKMVKKPKTKKKRNI